MENIGKSGQARISKAAWRVVGLSTFGTAMEFYDFIVYGIFAQYISTQFFPSASAVASLAQTFAIFALGYFARPIGGLVLAHFGDKIGRRPVFIFSLLAVSLATLAMALIPPYAKWGATATILFVLARLVQGVCFGGEIAGALTYVAEVMPQRSGLVCSFLFAIAGMGVVAASAVSALIHTLLSPEAIMNYGWRAAFLLGGVFGFVGFCIRGSLAETDVFANAGHTATRTPLMTVLRRFPRQLLIGIGLVAPLAAMNGLLFAHMPAYLGRLLHYSAATVADSTMIGVTALSVGVIGVGFLSDLLPRRWLHRTGALLLLLGAWPAYNALASHSIALPPLFLVIGLCGALVNGSVGAILADLFPTNVRFTGIAFTYNVSNAFFQGLTPLVATLLIAYSGSPLAPAYWICGAALVGFLSGIFLVHFERQNEAAYSNLHLPARGSLDKLNAK